MKMSRRRLLAGCAAISLAAFIPVPALAFQSSGNMVADMSYAIARNRGIQIAAAKEIAMAVGTSAAGGSIWRRILGRTPIGRLLMVATLAGAAYSIYKLTQDQYLDAAPPVPPDGEGWMPVSSTPIVEVATEADIWRLVPLLAPNQVVRFRASGSNFVYFAASRYVALPGTGLAPADAIQFYDGYSTYTRYRMLRWQQSSSNTVAPAGDDVTIDGVVFYRGYYSSSAAESYWTNKLFRWLNTIPPAYHPDAIPSGAVVHEDLIADDINENYARAKAANPTLPGFGTVIGTEVNAVAPASAPARQKGYISQNDPAPIPIVDDEPGTPAPNPTPTPGAGTGTGNGGETDDGWSNPPAEVGLPDDVGVPSLPTPDPISDRQGINVCPSLPGGIRTHCAPLESARPYLVNLGRLAGSAASLMMILRD